jgi:hypothetical protein
MIEMDVNAKLAIDSAFPADKTNRNQLGDNEYGKID